METVFAVSGFTVMPAWALMMVAPNWRWTRRLVASPAVFLAPLLLYGILVLPRLATILPVVARPELGAIATLLGQPSGATVAWVHFLGFDLFVGRWIYLDACERGLTAWRTSPILLITLLLGPLGLLIHLATRTHLVGRAWGHTHALIRTASAGSRPLTVVALGSAALLMASLVLQALDPRQVLGASSWLKPAKFGASVAFNALTMALILRQIAVARGGVLPRGLRRASLIMATMLVLELALITMQAARGVPSHFNATNTFNKLAFQVMGAGISLFWLMQAYVAYRSFKQRLDSRPLMWGIRFGLLATVIGGGLGFIMPIPSAAQRASLREGRPTPALGSHAVGVPDGGPGLPVTRWSTTGGDLRVPHFLGLHGLQVLPLLGWMFSRRRQRQVAHAGPQTGTRGGTRAETQDGYRMIVFAGVAYLGLVATTLVQALRAQPVLSPDAETLVLALAVICVAAVVAVFAQHRDDPHPTAAFGMPHPAPGQL